MRQYGCIELTMMDALLLRDLVRPLAPVQPYPAGAAIGFCEKLYDGILKMKAEGLEAINLPLEEQDALFINQFVGNEDWAGALQVLEQTWRVLYELRHRETYPHQPVRAPAFVQLVTPEPSTNGSTATA